MEKTEVDLNILESVKSVCLSSNDALENEVRTIHSEREVAIENQCIELIRVAAQYTELYMTLNRELR